MPTILLPVSSLAPNSSSLLLASSSLLLLCLLCCFFPFLFLPPSVSDNLISVPPLSFSFLMESSHPQLNQHQRELKEQQPPGLMERLELVGWLMAWSPMRHPSPHTISRMLLWASPPSVLTPDLSCKLERFVLLKYSEWLIKCLHRPHNWPCISASTMLDELCLSANDPP